MRNRLFAIVRRAAFATAVLFAGYSMFAVSSLHAQVTEDTTAATQDTTEADITQVLSEQGDYSQLVEALQRTGLDQELANEEAFTLFAPNDSAFQRLETPVAEMDEQELANTLRNHLVFDEVTSQQLAQMNEITVGTGEMIEIGENGSTVGEANIVEPDLRAQNGIIHGIDGVLQPTEMPAAEE